VTLHPIQQEMLRIEAVFEKEGPPPGPPLDQCIALMIEFDGDYREVLGPILDAEVKRAMRLMRGHYSEFAQMTERNRVAIGFLQGVTFARAAENLRKQTEREALETIVRETRSSWERHGDYDG
jgi:hypothetical protein